jgi:CheY-like chemotaxis protein
VEDDLDQVHSLTYLLRDMGYDVKFAINGYAALAIAQTFHPEVVLLDMGLPDLDGCEIARRLKKQGDPFVRIVAVTARSTDEDRRRSLAAGCEQHLVKPVHPATIGQLIHAR